MLLRLFEDFGLDTWLNENTISSRLLLGRRLLSSLLVLWDRFKGNQANLLLALFVAMFNQTKLWRTEL